MTPEQAQRVHEVFQQALAHPSEERSAFLAEACGDDEKLRAEVESLLAHDLLASHGFLRPPDRGERGDSTQKAAGEAGTPKSEGADPLVGNVVGRYRVLRLIGRGGMGVVYEAEQESPRRTVALKVIRAGLASESLLRRFEHEAQVLGKLDHPGIATIFEAGTFDTGGGPQPFFAMELVRGDPLSEFASENKLGIRQRLELVVKIADAVQHAHQKGVIHRDLKPANIIVNRTGEPKILDFGVARATDADVQATTLQTDIGQLVGTIPYMSPEQAAGQPADLDVRSDVYALGVVAYELLAGCLPYYLQDKMIHEAVRVIREDAPTPLSSLNHALRGDIEIIIGKALEKEKARRYQSASDLANDIRRYLHDEPIVARPPSTWYQLKKFTRRNKVLVGGIVAVLLALVVGIIGTTAGMVQANKARDAESRQRTRAEQVLYLSQIAQADRLSDERRFQEALTALDATMTDYRGWEYSHLYRRCRGQSLRHRLSFAAHADCLGQLAMSPDDKWLVSGSFINRARLWESKLWDLDTGASLATWNRPASNAQDKSRFAFSRDSRWLAIQTGDTAIELCRLPTAEPCSTIDLKAVQECGADMHILDITVARAYTEPLPPAVAILVSQPSLEPTWPPQSAQRRDESSSSLTGLIALAEKLWPGTDARPSQRTPSVSSAPAVEWPGDPQSRDVYESWMKVMGRFQRKQVVVLVSDEERRWRSQGVFDVDRTTSLITFDPRPQVTGIIGYVHYRIPAGRQELLPWLGELRFWGINGLAVATIRDVGQHFRFIDDGRFVLSLVEGCIESADLDRICPATRYESAQSRWSGPMADAMAMLRPAVVPRARPPERREWGDVCAFSADGARLYTGHADGTVKVWELPQGRCLEELHVTSGVSGVVALALSDDGTTLASGNWADAMVNVWSTVTTAGVENVTACQGRGVPLALDGSRSRALFCMDDRVRILEVGSGEAVSEFTWHGHPSAACFDRQGNRVAIGGSRDNDGAIFISASETGGRSRSIAGERGPIFSMAFSEDATLLVTGSSGRYMIMELAPLFVPPGATTKPIAKPIIQQPGRVEVWDVASGTRRVQLRADQDGAYAVAISSDAKFVAGGGPDKKVVVWRVDDGRQLAVLTGHRSNVGAVAFSVDGRYVASGSADCTARVWDTNTGRKICVLAHDNEVDHVEFYDHDRKLMTTTVTGVCSLWHIPTASRLLQLKPVTEELVAVALDEQNAELGALGKSGAIWVWRGEAK